MRLDEARGSGAELSGPLSIAVERLYEFRIRAAPADIRARLIGKGPIKHRVWQEGPILGLHIGSPTEIRDADRRLYKWGAAYPGLFGTPAAFELSSATNAVLKDVTIGAGTALFRFSGQSSVALKSVSLTPTQNNIPYLITFMAVVSVPDEEQLALNGITLLDGLLAKEIARARMSGND